ncbi:LOW QUALITY PROTEIN: Transposase [Phytophthora palmivora]|uniref:Transposase n=1 Tax=Phytophthora palmivora TaxID=4796 RepID=A0A2P4YTY9_9STRA|nr:LOW QUALITY PROTEIN: Transposase [Phytophthora palmivora]
MTEPLTGTIPNLNTKLEQAKVNVSRLVNPFVNEAGQYLAPQVAPVVESENRLTSIATQNTGVAPGATANTQNTPPVQGYISTPPPAVTRPGRSASGQSPSLSALYVNTLVAFSPTKEAWASSRNYVGVGSAYIVGRVCRLVKGLYQIRWLYSQFQYHGENMSLGMIQRGNTNYSSLHARANGPGWSQLCVVDSRESVVIDGSMDGLEVCMEHYEPPMSVPNSVAQVEAIVNFRFEPSQVMEAPSDLDQHADKTTATRLRPEFRHIFEHSASARFWQQVLGETNSYAQLNNIALRMPFTLQEIMTFLGILFYMSLVEKGEYSNYWCTQVEDVIFGGKSVGLDNFMPLRRFKQLRQCFTFRCVQPNSTNNDQAARIRPLLNLLKSTGPNMLKNVALDEASVACRKFGKPLIVYNPMKPVGKYHFRIYMMCCATSWIFLNFRLHCASTISDRLDGVASVEEANEIGSELAAASAIPQRVLEVVRPAFGTNRVVNSDDYYTSVQLLEALRVKGLYSRATVRQNSAHFPQHVRLEKKECFRGSSRQAVSTIHKTVAASCAPTCVKEYNTYMQGVDQLDQIRGRFSIADGHSFKKWFKKLGLALKSPIFALYTAWRCAKLSSQKAFQRPSCVRMCLGHAGTNIIGFTCQGIYSQAKVRLASTIETAKKYYGLFDFIKGFRQLPLAKNSQEILSYATDEGIFTPPEFHKAAVTQRCTFNPQWKNVLKTYYMNLFSFGLTIYSSKLSYPSTEATICLFCDASDNGWVIVLTQVEQWKSDKPVTEQCHEFLICKCNWSVTEKEGYPIVAACDDFNYVLLRPGGFRIYCDHCNLMYLFAPHPNLKKHLLRWAVKLSEYRYTIAHVEGQLNVWADLVSRWGRATTTTVQQFKRVTRMQSRTSKRPLFRPLDKASFVWPTMKEILATQTAQIKFSLITVHEMITIDADQLETNVFHKQCDTAFTTEKGGKTNPQPWGPFIRSKIRNEAINWDIFIVGESFGTSLYLLIIKANFSHFCELIPCDAPTTAAGAEAMLWWRSRYGMPTTWISDNATHFKSEVLALLSKLKKAKQHFVGAYSPWLNGSVERRAPIEVFTGLPCPSPVSTLFVPGSKPVKVSTTSNEDIQKLLAKLRKSIVDIHRGAIDQREKRILLNKTTAEGYQMSVVMFSVRESMKKSEQIARDLGGTIRCDKQQIPLIYNSDLEVTEELREHIAAQGIVLKVKAIQEHR